MKHTIDAQGKKIGRVASAAEAILMGKNTPTFTRNTVAKTPVEVINTAQADMNAKKRLAKVYVTYTGHRGGLNKETLGHLVDRKGAREAVRRAIYRMLPDNKLRDLRMKNLTVKE